MGGVVYDAGALIAADRGNPWMLDLHLKIQRARAAPVVPLVVLAQVWRGGTHPALSRLLKGCRLVPEDLALAKAAGIACAAAGTSDVVDAVVVMTAMRQGARIVTSDPHDLARIADAMGATVPLDVV